MFRRRNPLPVLHRARELVWPRRGWRRTTLYIAHRLGRLPGTPYRIAAGFACGAAISFTPLMGLHFVCAALLSLLMRGNVVASAVGTVIGNPWTFPFIWIWTYNLGRWLLSESGENVLPDDLSMHYIFENIWSVGRPMMIGGLPTALVAWFAFFWPAYAAVSEYQRRRRKRVREKVMKLKRQRSKAVYAGQGTENE
jgi:uncharacterized protein (DUF2062 family)